MFFLGFVPSLIAPLALIPQLGSITISAGQTYVRKAS